MVVIVDLCVFLISTYIALRAVTKIYHGRYSMLHFCVLIFYAMQVLPIFVSLFGKLDKIQLYYEYMYYAMIDDSVAYIYDLFLLLADQKGYIQYNVQTVTLIANTAACAVIISQGASIQFVKLTTSLIYLIRPILLQIYVDRNYQIDKKIEYKEEPIKQKWNGVAQHVAAVVLDGMKSEFLCL